MDGRRDPKEFLSYAAQDRLETVPQYKIDQTDDWIAKGASRISVVSADPDAFGGVDGKRIATYQNCRWQSNDESKKSDPSK